MKVFIMKAIDFQQQAKSFELPLESDEFHLQEVTGDTRTTLIRAINTMELIMTE